MRVRIAARFEGPPGFANGGYLAGTLAGRGPAQVTIRRPVPVETDLELEGGTLHSGEGALAEVEPLDAVDVGAVPSVPLEAARRAAAASPLAPRHPFPRCFGCGPAHPAGLHCLAGPVGDGVWAVAWTPEADDPAFVWSALDCTSAAPVVEIDGDPAFVLGRMAARIDGAVAASEPHVVAAWSLGEDGRRRHAAAALLGPGGEPVAVATATWFAVPSPR